MALPMNALNGSFSVNPAHTFPLQRAVPKFAAALAAPKPAPGSTIRGTNILRFSGRSYRDGGRNGVWVSVERIPAKVGGLGEVSKTIPEAIQKYANKDMRVMVPLLDPIEAEDYHTVAIRLPQTKSGLYKADAPKRAVVKSFLDEFPGAPGYQDALKSVGIQATPGGYRFVSSVRRKAQLSDNRQLVATPVKEKDGSQSLLIEMRVKKTNGSVFQPTGLTTQVVGPDGKTETFELYQKKEADTGNWVYAIKNARYFGTHDNLYHPLGRPVEGVGQDAMFNSIMLFNKAAAQFLPHLNASMPEQPGSRIAKFDGDADFLIASDWHTGPLLSELPENYQVAKLFMLHNTFDEPRRQKSVNALGLKVPPIFARFRNGQPTQTLKEPYSPLSIGIKYADAVIANGNYVRSITLSNLEGKRQFIKHLREKLLNNQVYDMHHGLSDAYDPYNNPALRSDGFRELRRFTRLEDRQRELINFTKDNQRALQTLMGLYRDGENGVDNYVVMSWAARFDPWQKGFYMLMNVVEDFLREHPNVQLVLAGAPANGDKNVEAWLERMRTNPEFKGRLALPGFVNAATVARINAGSDFTILPSLYEPYGLTQLECIKLGSIPIVTGVDGLRSTVSDPENRQEWFKTMILPRAEKVWDYGQTGIMLKPFDIPAYRSALGKQQRGDVLSQKDQAAIRAAHNSLRVALERALALGQDPIKSFQVRENGMKYVDEHHNWKVIVDDRYTPMIDEVVAQSRAGRRLLQFA